MSVLITGMEMPKTCVQCKLRYFDPERKPSDGIGNGTNCCWLTDEEIWNRQRGEQCPLIEVPPHGDLVDVDELLKKKWSVLWNGESFYVVNADDLIEAPTIVEEEYGV